MTSICRFARWVVCGRLRVPLTQTHLRDFLLSRDHVVHIDSLQFQDFLKLLQLFCGQLGNIDVCPASKNQINFEPAMYKIVLEQAGVSRETLISIPSSLLCSVNEPFAVKRVDRDVLVTIERLWGELLWN